jgi:hypothetical protein
LEEHPGELRPFVAYHYLKVAGRWTAKGLLRGHRLRTFEMAYKEEKKNWEVEQSHFVAAEMNKLHGTDYGAHPSDAEPADVVLNSKSGTHLSLPVQVVSIPLDFRH